MLYPDFEIRADEPINLYIENGKLVLFGLDLLEGDKPRFDSVKGRIVKLESCHRVFSKGRKYLYWRLVVQDADNVFWLWFPYLSGLFKDVVLCLASASDYSNVEIEPYSPIGCCYTRTRHSAVRIYADGIEMHPECIILPKIEFMLMSDGKTRQKDYTKRMQALKTIIEKINIVCENPTRALGYTKDQNNNFCN